MERLEKLAGAQPCYYILQAEVVPKQASLRRFGRSRVAARKECPDLNSRALSSVEVLENRNVERRG